MPNRLNFIEMVCERCSHIFSTKSTRALRCPDCRRLKWKLYKKTKNWEHSEKGKLHQKKYHLERAKKFKKIVFDYYGWHCNCCNERLVSMLSVDHVNNDGFKDRGLTAPGMYKKIIGMGFPTTFQILCMNCNWSKRINKGFCEHERSQSA